MSENETSGAGQDVEATSTDGASATEEPPAWFKSFVEKVDGRFSKFGKDLGAVREKIKDRGDDGRFKETEKAKPALSPEDLDAAMRLGEVRSQLSEDAKSYLDEQRTNGLSFGETLKLAETIHRFGAKPDEKGGAKPPPRGHGAKPPQSTPVLPTTQAEYMEWKRSSPAKAEAAANHPDFDFFSLPMR